jgi:hypothetical protein
MGAKMLDDLVDSPVNYSVACFKNGWLNKLSELKEKGIKPPVTESEVQEKYTAYAAEERFEELALLRKIMEIKPYFQPDVIQKIKGFFYSYWQNDRLLAFKTAKEATEIKYVPMENEVNERFRALLKERRFVNLKEWSELLETKLAEPIAQEELLNYFKQGQVEYFEGAINILEMKPKLPANIVQEKYAETAQKLGRGVLELWQKATGIKPSMMVQAVLEAHETGKTIGLSACMIKLLRERLETYTRIHGVDFGLINCNTTYFIFNNSMYTQRGELVVEAKSC